MVLSCIMVGCTGKGPRDEPYNIPEHTEGLGDIDEGVKLRVATMFGGTDPAAVVYEKALMDFQADNPHIVIEDESMTSEGDGYRTKVKTDFSSGNDLDVVFFYTGADVRHIIEAGKLMAYDHIWKDYPNLASDITPFNREAMREFDGKVYALPVTGFYEGLFVNKELFKENGIALPRDWEKFEKAIEGFRDAGITPIAGPLAQSHYLIEHFILSAAGSEGHRDVFSEGINTLWVEGLNNLKRVYDMKGFSPDATTMDIEMSQNLFREGKAAMILEGSWFIGGCSQELQEKMTVMPMPAAPVGNMAPGTLIAGLSSGYSISRKAYEDDGKREATVKLVNFLLSDDVIRDMAIANGGVPAADVVLPGLSPVARDGYSMYGKAKHLNMPMDSRLTPEAFNEIVKQGVPYIVTGEKTPESVLESVMKIQGSK